jgi:hypothetical protein
LRRFLLLSLLICFGIQVSCVGQRSQIVYGGMLTEAKVKKLQKEKTTSVEVVRLFGKPQDITQLDNGFIYFYKDLNLQALWLRFDSNGVLVEQKGP